MIRFPPLNHRPSTVSRMQLRAALPDQTQDPLAVEGCGTRNTTVDAAHAPDSFGLGDEL